ncbi:MAG: Mth938-like domain-containing protein [Pseudomonadota bacterium]|nr:Mth938-like domain-containing protein [Pseudomonadota bacterium]
MKLQPDRLDVQSILGYGSGWIGVANQGVAEKIEHSVVIGSRGEKFDWVCDSFEDLTEAHFARLVESGPELVIFGSGARLRFPPPALLRALMAARIGIETMDTIAACRTYNILAGEGRKVLAALLMEAPEDAANGRPSFQSKI